MVILEFDFIDNMYSNYKPLQKTSTMKKPKGFEDISQKRYEELVQEVEKERFSKKTSSKPRRRPQTAHYPLKSNLSSTLGSKPTSKKKKMSKRKKSEYMDIIHEYEDVLESKAKQRKNSKNRQKGSKKAKKPYTLISQHKDKSGPTEDPFEKYISFYPSRSSDRGASERKYKHG